MKTKKHRYNDILRNIVFVAIIVIGIFLTNIPNVLALREGGSFIVHSVEKAEIFSGYEMSRKGQPAKLFSEDGIFLFCIEKGQPISTFMTASKAHYIAWKDNTESNGEYDPSSPAKFYRRSAEMGLIASYESDWTQWDNHIADLTHGNCRDHSSTEYADDADDQDVIDQLDTSLPGIGTDVIKSIEYRRTRQFTIEDEGFIAASFILTQQKIYNSASDAPADESVSNLTEEQKELGWFCIDEKQYALWRTKLNIGYEAGNDRGLSEIANNYEEFYKKIHTGNGYEDIVEVKKAEDDQQIIEGEMSLGGDNCKSYEYKNADVVVDSSAGCHIIGPFKVDYTFNDEKADIFSSTPTNEVKYNAIEKITVYNQNKVDIESLGGYFKVAYSYNGGLTSENEGKLRRISDEYYYEKADYREISAFESNRPFYIIVYRGSMKVEDFTGFYAKIDMQYLEDIQANLYEYEGHVIHYYYTREQGTADSPNYIGTPYTRGSHDYPPNGNCSSSCNSHHHGAGTPENKTFTMTTYTYTLHREESGEHSQKMLGYDFQGTRRYNTYSIILTTDWDKKQEPKIELLKICKNPTDTHNNLFGAEYTVTLEISGTDSSGNSISKTLVFERVTDVKGILSITSEEIASKGVFIGTFTGTINVRFKETKAPAGHRLRNW